MGTSIMDFGVSSVFKLWHHIDVTNISPVDENKPFANYNLPTFDVFSLFHRLCKRIHFNINPSQIVILHALEYVKRLRRKASKYHDSFNGDSKVLPPGSESIVFLIALILAKKFADDDKFSAIAWSQATGISIDEINRMERECLSALDYKLSVPILDLYDWSKSLKTFLEIHHPGDVASVIIVPIVAATRDATSRATETDDDTQISKRRLRCTTTATNSNNGNYITSPETISTSQQQSPAEFRSPPLGRIENYHKSKLTDMEQSAQKKL